MPAWICQRGGGIKIGFNKSSRLYREISCQCRKGSEDTSYLVPMSVRVRPSVFTNNSFFRAGNETDLVSSRDFASRDPSRKINPSKTRKHGRKKSKFEENFGVKFSWSRISSRLLIFFVSRPNQRDRRVSRLVTCRLDLVSSRDFRLITGPRIFACEIRIYPDPPAARSSPS